MSLILFEPLRLRGVTLRNRIALSPMCTYSADEGMPNDWHRIHLATRAVGGVGLVMTEATAVAPEGRISPADTGLWNDRQAEAWTRVVPLLHDHGAVAGIQIAHAGRKAGTRPPWAERGIVPPEEGGWVPVAPSPIPFHPGTRTPRELSAEELPRAAHQWAEAAGRARDIGFDLLEIHMAHGYLLHQFLSPLTNRRRDRYGGERENRFRFPLEVVDAVRGVWPEDRPLLVRISASDWVEGGWSVDEAVPFCRALADRGVDLVDCSSGGAVPEQRIPTAPGFQVPFARRIREEARMATGAVGLITEPEQAETILRERSADLILMGRELLRDPYWPHHAAARLGGRPSWPKQYGWAVNP